MADTFRPRTASGNLAGFYFDLARKKHRARELRIQTDAGIRVRSHPESQIVEALQASGMRWWYEPSLYRKGSTKPVSSPDFLIRGSDGHAWIWEHLGLLEDPSYLASHRTKSTLYDELGILRPELGGGTFATLILTTTRGYDRLSEAKISDALALVQGTRAA